MTTINRLMMLKIITLNRWWLKRTRLGITNPMLTFIYIILVRWWSWLVWRKSYCRTFTLNHISFIMVRRTSWLMCRIGRCYNFRITGMDTVNEGRWINIRRGGWRWLNIFWSTDSYSYFHRVMNYYKWIGWSLLS